MLMDKTEKFVEGAKAIKKRIHRAMMDNDTLSQMNGEEFELVRDILAIIDEALEVERERSKTLARIDSKLSTVLEKMD